MSRFADFKIWLWVVGWPRIQEVTGYSLSWIESLLRYERFPLRFGPANEVRIHPLECWKWILPEELGSRIGQRDKTVGFSLQDSPLLGLERIFLSGYKEISWYCGFKDPNTSKRFQREYRLPCFKVAGRVRAAPPWIDVFFTAWDGIMKERRRDHYFLTKKSRSNSQDELEIDPR
jgi:hypothetical protein